MRSPYSTRTAPRRPDTQYQVRVRRVYSRRLADAPSLWLVAEELFEALPQRRRGPLGTRHLDETLEAGVELVATRAVAAVGEMVQHLVDLRPTQLTVDQLVEPLDALLAVHYADLP